MKAITTPVNVLASFYYFGKGPSDAFLDQAPGMRFIGDSGAFSALSKGASIDIHEYAGWCQRHRFAWVASLDVIGNPEASWRNWRSLAALGVESVPTIHYGTPAAEVDRYVDAGAALIGLGGMARRSDRPSVMRWLVSVFRYARDRHPHVRFHGWGVTHTDYLRHLPFWSVDSSGFFAGCMFGRALIFDPRAGRSITIELDGATTGRYGRLLREEYGITPREAAVSNAGNRGMHTTLAVLSSQHMATYYQARHRGVSPPPGHTEVGPLIHVVSMVPDYRHIAATITATRKEPAA